MSITTTTEESPARTVRLANGQTFQFTSNKSEALDQIPIIDITGMYSEKLEERQAVAEKIRKASHEIGFFYIINHVSKPGLCCLSLLTLMQGIDPKFAESAFEQAKKFFSLTTEEKMEVFTGKVPGEYVGYHPMEHYNRNQWKHRGRVLFPICAWSTRLTPLKISAKHSTTPMTPHSIQKPWIPMKFPSAFGQHRSRSSKLNCALTRHNSCNCPDI